MTLYDDNKEKYDSLPKDLFRLVQNDEEIHDVEFKTKPIGFFMDVWLRFVKNKASVVAAVIILFNHPEFNSFVADLAPRLYPK